MDDIETKPSGAVPPPAPGSAEWRENAKRRIGWTKLDGCKWRSPGGEIYYEFNHEAWRRAESETPQRVSTPAPSNCGGSSLPNAKALAATTGYACLTVADPKLVPKEIAVCPECGGRLWWQVETTDGLRDLSLDCENEPDMDEENDDMYHRWWQGEWQPVIDIVRRWLGSGRGTHAPGELPGATTKK